LQAPGAHWTHTSTMTCSWGGWEQGAPTSQRFPGQYADDLCSLPAAWLRFQPSASPLPFASLVCCKFLLLPSSSHSSPEGLVVEEEETTEAGERPLLVQFNNLLGDCLAC
jgi:hypothetical protein